MSATYVFVPSTDTGNDGVPRTTVTITSYYTAESTSASSSSGNNSSSSSSSTSPGSRKFAALAVGGALGGFALTCIIGWICIWWWRKRWAAQRLAAADGETGPVLPPVLGVGALRSDAENFPGWRRTRASRLQETDGQSLATTDIMNERRSSSFGGHLLTSMDEIRPPNALVTRPLPSTKGSILPLQLPATPDLTRECTKAFSKVGRSRGSVSSKSSSSLGLGGGADRSPKSPPMGTTHLAFLAEQRSEEDGSATAEHSTTYAHGSGSSGGGAPGLPGSAQANANFNLNLTNLNAGQRATDLASQSSHGSSSQYHAAYHPPPASYHGHTTQQQYFQSRPTRTPSPTQHRRNSASSQTSVLGGGPGAASSWHGHSSAPSRPGHASWHGPSLATMHWSGYLPQFGPSANQNPTGNQPSAGPPSSWLGHLHFPSSHHNTQHARSLSSSGFTPTSSSSQRPLLPHTAQGSGSSGSQPPPKFFFQPPSAAGSRAPTPPPAPQPPPSPPPTPLDPPERRLTVMNPDLNSSPATSSVNLPPTPDELPLPPGGTPPSRPPLERSPLSQS